MGLFAESICPTCVIESPSPPGALACPSVCPSDISSGFSSHCVALCVGFCSSRRDAQSIPQMTQTLRRITSRLLVEAVSVAQWQEEIKPFMERPGDGRDGLLLLRLSVSQVLRAAFYFKRDLRTLSNIKYWGQIRFCCLVAIIFSCKHPVSIAAVGRKEQCSRYYLFCCWKTALQIFFFGVFRVCLLSHCSLLICN